MTTLPPFLDGRPKPLFIDGRSVAARSGKTFDTVNPASTSARSLAKE